METSAMLYLGKVSEQELSNTADHDLYV